MKIILAQGNPGLDYEKTRHNIGFMVVDNLATQKKAVWVKKPKFQAMVTQIEFGSEKALLVKPDTFYNETGTSARKLVDFYKLDAAKDMLVVHDDLALPFGTIRVRGQGRDAGNNGIKSLNANIDHHYTRIRIGILNEFREKMGDTNFVVSNFRNDEARKLKQAVIPTAIELIEKFCSGKLEHTSYDTLIK